MNRYYRSIENFTEFLLGLSFQIVGRHFRGALGALTLEYIGAYLSHMGSVEESDARKRTYGLGKERKQWFDKVFSENNPQDVFKRILNYRVFVEEFGHTESN